MNTLGTLDKQISTKTFQSKMRKYIAIKKLLKSFYILIN